MAQKRTTARELLLAAIASGETSDRLMRGAVERSFDPYVIKGVSPSTLAKRNRPLLAQVSPHHVSHNVLRRIERNGLSIRKAISFKAQIHEMSEARRLGVLRPSWKLDVKNNAYAFVDAIGARRPVSDRKAYSWKDLDFTFPSVVKATRSTGSRGCYLLYSPEHIVHARDAKVLSSIEALGTHADNLMTRAANPLPNRWMVEELVLENSQVLTPARDLKFYIFYGEIILMRESRRDQGLKVAYWDADGKPTTTGRYEDAWFEGIGFTESEAQTVIEISRQIPHPFMRIDMLKGENEVVLGEFTPRPGGFDQFDDHWDRVLGEAWVRAESRLLGDLLDGKRFDAFVNATNILDDR